MIVFRLEQRWEILRHYFENRGNVAECVRKLRSDFGWREAPSAPYVHYLVKKVKQTGILIDKQSVKSKKQCVHPRILLLWQKVRPINHPRGFRFVKCACDRFTEDADFGKKKIIFSEEAHFDPGGFVNKQNCRIWGTENPNAYIEKKTHPKKVTVWFNYRIRYLTFFSTSSCLIRQIISFILPPNEYGCVYACTTLGCGPANDLQKMPILAKKKSSFQMKLILILASM